MSNTVLVEVLTASGCGRCQKAEALAKTVIAQLVEEDQHAHIQYREVNVVEEIDYAVALGVMNSPAIALNGKLIFSTQPSADRLRQAIKERLASE